MAAGEVAQIVDKAAAALARVREVRPRVHCLTNFVAMKLSANLLLASGAVPSMTMDARAMPDFVESTEALVVNLGMLDPWRREAAPVAIEAARRLGRPWVLDPVKVDRSGERRAFAQGLLDQAPAVLRCNTAERPLLDVPPATVTALTGEIDRIEQAGRLARIAGGSLLMDRVTAMGCAASALTGAFLAIEAEAFEAAAAAMLVMKVAGTLAEREASGPGSFEPAFLDAVFNLDARTLQHEARLS